MQYVTTREENEIFYIDLARAEKRNAFDPQMIEEIKEAFQKADQCDSRIVLLKGQGKSFSAGADLNWMKSMVDYSLSENQKDSLNLHHMFEAGRICRLPIVGVAHGHVMGGALGLLSICDIVYCEESTKLAFSEVRIGLAPAVISPFVLRKAIGSKVKELMLSGRVFTAAEAKDAGLVNFLFKEDEMEEVLLQVANQFRALAPEALRETKRLIQSYQSGLSWRELKDLTSTVIAERRVSPEGQEGLTAFFEQRDPAWKLGEIRG